MRTNARWPVCHRPGLRWISKVERKLLALNREDQGAFISITNAIEYQLEIGGHPETLRLLIASLAEFATASGILPAGIGIDATPDELIQRLGPRAHPPR